MQRPIRRHHRIPKGITRSPNPVGKSVPKIRDSFKFIDGQSKHFLIKFFKVPAWILRKTGPGILVGYSAETRVLEDLGEREANYREARRIDPTIPKWNPKINGKRKRMKKRIEMKNQRRLPRFAVACGDIYPSGRCLAADLVLIIAKNLGQKSVMFVVKQVFMEREEIARLQMSRLNVNFLYFFI